MFSRPREPRKWEQDWRLSCKLHDAEAELGPRAVLEQGELVATLVDMCVNLVDRDVGSEVTGGVEVDVGGRRQIPH